MDDDDASHSKTKCALVAPSPAVAALASHSHCTHIALVAPRYALAVPLRRTRAALRMHLHRTSAHSPCTRPALVSPHTIFTGDAVIYVHKTAICVIYFLYVRHT